jgi:transcriptional regulator with XRE-family HTH domain
MNELRQYKIENRCLQKEIANKLGYSESKVTRLMKVKTSLKDILTYSEYKEMMERLNVASELFYDSIELAVNSAHGIYIPMVFCERYKQYIDPECVKYFTNEDNIHRDLHYIEEWIFFTDNETLNINGTEYNIIQNEDLWLVPTNIEIPESWFI